MTRTLHTWLEDGKFRSEPVVWCAEHDEWFLLPAEQAVLDLHVELFHA